MSLVTLGRANFLRFCPFLYYNAVSRLGGLANPALLDGKLLIIRIAFLQRKSPAANGSVPNLVGGLSIFS